jgi:hypothetical protein
LKRAQTLVRVYLRLFHHDSGFFGVPVVNIESQIADLGQVFNKLGTMIGAQAEVVQRSGWHATLNIALKLTAIS